MQLSLYLYWKIAILKKVVWEVENCNCCGHLQVKYSAGRTLKMSSSLQNEKTYSS